MLKKIIVVIFAVVLMAVPQYTSAQKVLVYSEDQISLYLETDESGKYGLYDLATTYKYYPDGDVIINKYQFGYNDHVFGYEKFDKNFHYQISGNMDDDTFDAELARMIWAKYCQYVLGI